MSFQILLNGDCLNALRSMSENSVDAVVCDPPYELGFMGKKWDGTGIAFDPATWREVFRVLSPGGYLLAFGGTRTYHRLACAIEDAGFEIRDCVMWQFGSGFPKSLNIGNGLGTALKPAFEPVVVARKPLTKGLTVAANVLKHGTGAMNIDGCRVATTDDVTTHSRGAGYDGAAFGHMNPLPTRKQPGQEAGRWPANVILTHAPGCVRVGSQKVKATSGIRPDDVGTDYGKQHKSGSMAGAKGVTLGATYADADGTETVAAYECAPGCPVAALDAQSGQSTTPTKVTRGAGGQHGAYSPIAAQGESPSYGDTGGASRFFTTTEYGDDDLPGAKPGDPPFLYNTKASRSEREAGCGDLPGKTAVEAVGRDPESAGAKNPRAGAGRGAGAVREACALCGVAVGASGRRGIEAKPCPESEDGKHVPETRETGVVIRNTHPTVKPVAVMRWLIKLVTPPGGVVLDPFMGSGTTGVASVKEGFSFIGIEREPEYITIAEARIRHHGGTPEIA